MFTPLDPLLLSQPRLAIMSLLTRQQEAEFMVIQESTKVTSGNLSIQLNKLKEAEYIEITKQFKGNYPLTICKITAKGVEAINHFIRDINTYDENNISKVISEEWSPSSINLL